MSKSYYEQDFSGLFVSIMYKTLRATSQSSRSMMVDGVCVSERKRIRLCVCVCVCVWFRRVNDSQRRHSDLWQFIFFFLVCVCVCVLRGSEIRGATKSFLTLTHTHSVACLSNRVTFSFLFFFFSFFFTDFVCRASVWHPDTEWEDRQRRREREESDGGGRWRSHLGVRMTEGRKRDGRRESGGWRERRAKGQVFERRRKCVWQTIPDLSLYFPTSLRNCLFSFLCHVDCRSGPCPPSLWPNLLFDLERKTETNTHTHTPTHVHTQTHTHTHCNNQLNKT